MKVVRKGKPPKEEIFQGECHTCKSVMEEKRANLTIVVGDQREPGDFAHAVCPVCGSDFIMYPKARRR